jgi:peptide-methionine (S)-S-oxide reductase
MRRLAIATLMFAPALLGAQLLAAAPAKRSPTAARVETAVLAGGCFWGMEAVFEHVKGVRDVVSGYAGGSAADATYDKVSSEETGHAEAVRITYDPRQISYAQLLRVYFTAAHDPTQLNRQYPDTGPSYRSAIFPRNQAQVRMARAQIAQLGKASGGRIVTRIESGAFYPAESGHQDFMRRNPRHPYILAHDVQKLAKLKALFPALYKG